MWDRMHGCCKNTSARLVEAFIERLPGRMDVFLDSSLAVHMPRLITVENRRLGFILRVLQLIALSSMIWYGTRGGCYREYTPTGFRQSLWFHPAVPKTAHREHCVAPETYWYNFSHISSARPTGCKWLPHESAYDDSASYTLGGNGLFFPLHVQDEILGSNSSCQNDGGLCTTSEDFFLENPEEQILSIFHGFEVGKADGSWVGRGVSTDDRITAGPALGGERTEIGDMITHIIHPDGSSCAVGGKSEWTAADSQSGITGTLEEWLECAGVTLDTDPRALSPDMPDGLAPHLRTMGFAMQVVVDYKNEHTADHVDCTLSVRVLPAWTVRKHTDIIQHPGTGLSGSLVSRSRRAMGVSVSLKVTGSFSRFDFERTMHFFIDSFVLMQVPIIVVRCLALFCMGSLSSVYRRARSLKVNLFHDFHSSLARMMVATASYRHLVGADWDEPAAELPGLTHGMMFEHMRDVFAEPINSGALQIDDLRGMNTALFSLLDKDGTGEIGCSEFIQAFISHDAIKVEDVAHFFARYGQRGKASSVLRGWLDDSYQHRDDSVKVGRQHVSSLPIPVQEDQEQDTAESECRGSGESGDAGSNKTGSSEPPQQSVPGTGALELLPADAKQPVVCTQKRSMKWLEQEILTMRENTPIEGLSGVCEQAKQQQAAAATHGSSNWDLDYLGLLSALQVSVADIERRLEKLEIKDMEGQITGWTPEHLEEREVHKQRPPKYYLQVLSRRIRSRRLEMDHESAAGPGQRAAMDTRGGATSLAVPKLPATGTHSMVLGACTSGDVSAKQTPELQA